MYTTSQELLHAIRASVQRVGEALPNLAFDEYIAIPAYGTNVILRFDYTGAEPLSLESLDELERRLRALVGADFIANLMGDASRQCGLDLSRLNEILIRIDQAASIKLPACARHRTGLTGDARSIRAHFGLDDTVPLWEIQANPEGLLVLALHPAGEQPPFTDRESNLDGQPVRVHFLPDDGSFSGLMKAAALAAEKNVSITHVLLDFASDFSV